VLVKFDILKGMNHIVSKLAILVVVSLNSFSANAAMKWPAEVLVKFKTGPVQMILASGGTAVIVQTQGLPKIRVERGTAPTEFIVNAKSFDIQYMTSEDELRKAIATRLPRKNASLALLVPDAKAKDEIDATAKMEEGITILISATSNRESCLGLKQMATMCPYAVAQDGLRLSKVNAATELTHNESTDAEIELKRVKDLCALSQQLALVEKTIELYPAFARETPAMGSSSCADYSQEMLQCKNLAAAVRAKIPSAKECADRITNLKEIRALSPNTTHPASTDNAKGLH
jgi:hypothetical protein